MPEEFFFPEPKQITNIVYAYSIPGKKYEGLINIGFTSKSFEERIKQQFPKKSPNNIVPYTKLLEEPAIRNDGTFFMDHAVHKVLKNAGFKNMGGEWFKCTVDDIRAAIVAVRNYEDIELSRIHDFRLRPEQQLAVNKTKEYFQNIQMMKKLVPLCLY